MFPNGLLFLLCKVIIKTAKDFNVYAGEYVSFRNKYNRGLSITLDQPNIKNGEEKTEQHIIGVPKNDMVIKNKDTLVVFGAAKSVERFIEINESL